MAEQDRAEQDRDGARSRALQAGRRIALSVGVGFALFGLALAGAGFARAQTQAAAAPASAGDTARGKVIFELCSQCHGPAGQGSPSAQAPSIAGLDAWYIEEQLRKFKSGMRGRHPDDYTGMRMRPMTYTFASDSDIPAVAAYVASLPKQRPAPILKGGDAARGAPLYAVCSACHGPAGEGMEALKAPALNHASDWYLVETLKKFRTGVRGGDPRDTNGTMMRPMAMTLPDDQALADVVAHIGTLGAAPKPQ